MATTYKVLGQVNPAATTATTAYTVPSATQAIVSTISICNQAGTDAVYRIAVRPAGATLDPKHYVIYGATVPASDSTFCTLGLTLGAGDIITVYASSANISFNVYGSEIA